LARLSWKRKRRKTPRGRHLVAKTQVPARQFAQVIVLIGASCTIGTGAVAFWVGIASETLRLQEARRLLMAEGLDVAMAGLRVGYESPAQFSANTAVCLAHRVHATSPRRLPRWAAARMNARNEA
jgi:hypothetical protein